MALVRNTAEGQSNGTSVTTANSGAGSGDAFTLIAKSGASVLFSTDFAMHGTQSYKASAITTSGFVLGWSGYSTNSVALKGYVYFSALPDVLTNFVLADNASSAQMCGLYVDTSGHLSVRDAGGVSRLTSTSTLTAGNWYRFELFVNAGTTTSNGTIKAAVYLGDSATPLGDMTYTSTTANTGTTTVGSARFGIPSATATATANTYYLDDLAANDGASDFIGLPPTASFTLSAVGMDGVFNGSSSTASSPNTLSSYAWNFGDSGTSSSVNPTHTYAAAGTYTVTLTVTDSVGQTSVTSHSLTITAPTTQALLSSVSSSSGLTSNSGTVLNAVSDTSSGAPVLSTFASGSTGASLQGQIGPIAPPASGSPLVAVVYIDRLNSTSGTVTGQLYQGSSLISTATASIPDMTASGGSGTVTSGTISSSAGVTLVFPWSDVSAVSDWNQLTFQISVSVS